MAKNNKNINNENEAENMTYEMESTKSKNEINTEEKTKSEIAVITVGGREYKLGFTRESVARLEDSGFGIKNLENATITQARTLVHTAIRTFQPGITKMEQSMDIFDQYYDEGGDTGALTQFLIEEYSFFINKLLSKRTTATKTFTTIQRN